MEQLKAFDFTLPPTPKHKHGPIENGTGVPLEILKPILRGDCALALRNGASSKTRLMGSHGELYLCDERGKIVPLPNGTFPVPGLAGVSIRIEREVQQVSFVLDEKVRGRGLFSYREDVLTESEKEHFNGKLTALAAQEVSQQKARTVRLVAATLFAVIGVAAVEIRSCSGSGAVGLVHIPGNE